MNANTSFASGMIAGICAMALLGATRPPSPPEPPRPVEVTLHRFDMVPGREAVFRDWIAFLHACHRDAVATLARERTYLEAMFTAPDEPRRLYWLTVQGAPVESSTLDLDRRHTAYMDAVLAKGSHARLTTQNVLAPDFLVRAVREEQMRENRIRSSTHYADPDLCGGELDEDQVVGGVFLVSGGDGSEVLQLAEEALDQVALTVGGSAEGWR